MKAPLFAKAELRQPGPVAGGDARQRQAVAACVQDQRPAALAQRTLQQMANQSPQARRLQACAQLMEQARPARESKPAAAAAAAANGLPVQLKAGIEALSGMRMDHVRVHYNSPRPAQLKAHAFAQGNAIHLAPGQERHLPHEAWHVVQQAQGRVRPTLKIKQGVAVNDDASLEQEADAMGARALSQGGAMQQKRLAQGQADIPPSSPRSAPEAYQLHQHLTVQRIVHKLKTAESQAYQNAVELAGVSKKDMREKMDDPDRHYVYDKISKTLKEVDAPRLKNKKNKKKKSPFVLEHERKSRLVKNQKLQVDPEKRKRVEDIFEVSEKILKQAKTKKGNKVYDLHRILIDVFDNKIDKKKETQFSHHFDIGKVHFSVMVKKPSNLKTYEDLLAVTHVSLEGTKGKSSYASLVENKLYPTVGGRNDSIVSLYGLEALRNPKFIPTLVMKSRQVEGLKITAEDAINPEKFGVHELSGAAGKDRDLFDNQRINNTDRLLDEIDDNDDLKKKILTDPDGYEKECEDMCAIQ
ncbi:DUF4157 domain-containing protein [Undibacterium sp. Di26W]|uniref:eCIS core domain-containing protein n=1 Tax=Undibacterium sp. Di26W TaxID=3413035 RepID=UPI003BF081AB